MQKQTWHRWRAALDLSRWYLVYLSGTEEDLVDLRVKAHLGLTLNSENSAGACHCNCNLRPLEWVNQWTNTLKGNRAKDGVLVKSALANSAMWVNKRDPAYSSLPEYFSWSGSHSNALPFVNAHHLRDSHNASQAFYIPECLCTKVHVIVPTRPHHRGGNPAKHVTISVSGQKTNYMQLLRTCTSWAHPTRWVGSSKSSLRVLQIQY